MRRQLAIVAFCLPLAVLVLWTPIGRLIASFTASPQSWTAAFEGNPANTDSVGQGDDHIRQVKAELRHRVQTDHKYGSSSLGAGSDDTGRHREGSARVFVTAADPTTIGQEEVIGGVADYDPAGGPGSTALDDGRVAFRTDTGQFRVRNTGAWVEAVTALAGGAPNAANRLNLLGGIQFLKAGANAIDIHGHAARHRDVLTAGAATGHDYILGLIQAIKYTTVNTFGGNPVVGATTLTSDTLDTTGRRDTTRVLIIGSMQITSPTTTLTANLCIDDSVTSCLTGGDNVYGNSLKSASLANNSDEGAIVFMYNPALAVGPPTTFRLRANVSLADDYAARHIQFIIIDLGTNS